MPLTKAQLIALQASLERELLDDPFFLLPLNQLRLGLVHAALRHQTSWLKAFSKWSQGDDEQYDAETLVPAADVLSFALWLVDNKIRPRPRLSNVSTISSALSKQAFTVFGKIAKYALIWDMVRMCLNGDKLCDQTDEHEYTFRFVDNIDLQFMAAERLFAGDGGGNLAAMMEQTEDCRSSSQRAFQGTIDSFNPERSSFRRLRLRLESTYSHLQIFPGDIAIKSYTISDYRAFWACACAFTLVHRWLVLMRARILRRPVDPDAELMRLSFSDWTNLFMRYTPLNKRQVETLLRDFSYDPSALQWPDSGICPPFLKVGELWCLVPTFLVQSNPDELLFRQLERVSPSRYQVVKDNKEQFQLDRIENWVNQTEFQMLGPFKNVQVTGRPPTDLDLLIVDMKKKEALCCQLKSSSYPRWRNLMPTVAKDLDKGTEQCITSVEWLSQGPQSVSQELHISQAELRQFSFYGLVISAKSLGGGLAKRNVAIPIIPERFLQATLDNVSRTPKRISQFWPWFKSAWYLPIIDIDVFVSDLTCDISNRRFILEKSYAEPRR